MGKPPLGLLGWVAGLTGWVVRPPDVENSNNHKQ